LTRAGFLANNSNEDDSGPVGRGIFVMQSLLCSPPLPPPKNVPTQPSAAMGAQNHQTTRQRLDAHLNYVTCRGCHSVIDGIGDGFEEFDALGVYRTTENGAPVDPSGNVLIGDVVGTFTGVNQLEDKLLQSAKVLVCVMRQFYRYTMGQQETDSNGMDLPAATQVLAAMQQGFTADSHVTDALKQLVINPAFVLRTTAQAKP